MTEEEGRKAGPAVSGFGPEQLGGLVTMQLDEVKAGP